LLALFDEFRLLTLAGSLCKKKSTRKAEGENDRKSRLDRAFHAAIIPRTFASPHHELV
jgi:hypothetical protein